jgi:DNA-binding transcriptional ArsR family regulator
MLAETQRPLHIEAVTRNLEMDYGAVYRHVKVLKEAGLLHVFEVGRSRVLSPINIDLIKQFIENAKAMAK